MIRVISTGLPHDVERRESRTGGGDTHPPLPLFMRVRLVSACDALVQETGGSRAPVSYRVNLRLAVACARSLPSGSARTTHDCPPGPTSARVAPSAGSRCTSASWSSGWKSR